MASTACDLFFPSRGLPGLSLNPCLFDLELLAAAFKHGFSMSAGLGQPFKGTGAPLYRDTQEWESTSGPGGQVHTCSCTYACMY